MTKFLETRKSCRLVYKRLVSKKCEKPKLSQRKWVEDVGVGGTITIEINWKAAFQLPFECTKSTNLRVFHFKFLHRRLPTNNFLKKIGLADDDKCTFCKTETEKLIHLFWRCPKTCSFWNSFESWLQSLKIYQGDQILSLVTALGLRLDSSKYNLEINFCCLCAKHYIWICKLNQSLPSLGGFLTYFKHLHKVETYRKTASQKSGTSFCRVYSPLAPRTLIHVTINCCSRPYFFSIFWYGWCYLFFFFCLFVCFCFCFVFVFCCCCNVFFVVVVNK